MPLAPSNIRCVSSFAELQQARFAGSLNAACWPRVLEGNFEEVARVLGATNNGVVSLDAATLEALTLSAAGRRAVRTMLRDLELLRERGLEPELNFITRYPRDDGPVPTDVHSFHVDQAPFETDTWLCTYYGMPSQGLYNDQAERCVDSVELRAQLLQQFGGKESPEFEAYLQTHSYHLHYRPTREARPWSFGVGYLWRIATVWPGCPAFPCIHRAPDEVPEQPRLLLIS